VIAYVESNFVLEIALGQEQASEAGSILALAESRDIEIAYPVIALTEPFSTVTYRHLERARLGNELARQVSLLRRSMPHSTTVSAIQPVLPLLGAVGRTETDLVTSVASRLLSAGRPIPLDADCFAQSLTYRDTYGLSPQDAIVLSAVIIDLRAQELAGPKCFVSKNWRDFDAPDIRAQLAQNNCRYIEEFSGALSFVRSQLE
jgi:predicted nucleic acid-binding protein